MPCPKYLVNTLTHLFHLSLCVHADYRQESFGNYRHCCKHFSMGHLWTMTLSHRITVCLPQHSHILNHTQKVKITHSYHLSLHYLMPTGPLDVLYSRVHLQGGEILLLFHLPSKAVWDHNSNHSFIHCPNLAHHIMLVNKMFKTASCYMDSFGCLRTLCVDKIRFEHRMIHLFLPNEDWDKGVHYRA